MYASWTSVSLQLLWWGCKSILLKADLWRWQRMLWKEFESEKSEKKKSAGKIFKSDFQLSTLHICGWKNLDPGGSSTKGILYIGIGTLLGINFINFNLEWERYPLADVVNTDTYLKILLPISNYGYLRSCSNQSFLQVDGVIDWRCTICIVTITMCSILHAFLHTK